MNNKQVIEQYKFLAKKLNRKKNDLITNKLIKNYFKNNNIDFIKTITDFNETNKDLKLSMSDYNFNLKMETELSYLLFPEIDKIGKLSNIEKALEAGHKLKVFLSGGGLRVTRLDNKLGNNLGYGEHPYLSESLKHCDEDFAAGKRSYKDVYAGENSLYQHYLTGNSYANDNLDRFIRRGNTIKAYYDNKNNNFIVKIFSYQDFVLPERITKQCKEYPEKIFHHTSKRGITYQSEACYMADNSLGVTTKVIFNPDKKEVFFWKIVKIGRGKCFWSACLAAIAAIGKDIKKHNL